LSSSDQGQARDERPLQHLYELLLLVCDAETVMRWGQAQQNPVHKSYPSQKRLKLHLGIAHSEAFGQHALDDFFAKAGALEWYELRELDRFCKRDLQFALRVLEKTAGAELRTLESSVTMASLNNLARRLMIQRASRGKSPGFWALAMRCLERCEALRSKIGVDGAARRSSPSKRNGGI